MKILRNKIGGIIGSAAQKTLRSAGERLFPERLINQVPRRPPETSPRQWYAQELIGLGLDPEIEKKRGLFAYLDNCLPPAPAAPYRPLRIAFIQAGPGSVELDDGTRYTPSELFGFIVSVQGTAGAILGAIRADAALNFDLEHSALTAYGDEPRPHRLNEQRIRDIADNNDIVMLGSNWSAWQRAEELIIALKRRNPALIIVMGGHYATTDPPDPIAAGTDYLVRYDGCVSACGLVRAIAAGLSDDKLDKYLKQVPNLFYRDAAGQFVRTPRMSMRAEFGSPLPPFVSTEFYPFDFRRTIRTLSNGATTGCPYRCEMCVSCRVTALTRRPIEHFIADLERMRQLGELEPAIENELEIAGRVVLSEIQYRVAGDERTKYFPREIFLWDDNLTYAKNQDYALELFQAMTKYYTKNRLKPIFITVQVGVDFFENEELVRAARRAGVKRVCCGFESTSENALKLMKKKRVHFDRLREQYRTAAETARRNDIAIHGYLMIGFNETYSEILDMAEFFKEIGIGSIQVLFQGPWSKKWMILDDPTLDDEPMGDFHKLRDKGMIASYFFDKEGKVISSMMTAGAAPVIRAEHLSYEELNHLRLELYRKYYSVRNILETPFLRKKYPNWAATFALRLQTRVNYLNSLLDFNEKLGWRKSWSRRTGSLSSPRASAPPQQRPRSLQNKSSKGNAGGITEHDLGENLRSNPRTRRVNLRRSARGRNRIELLSTLTALLRTGGGA